MGTHRTRQDINAGSRDWGQSPGRQVQGRLTSKASSAAGSISYNFIARRLQKCTGIRRKPLVFFFNASHVSKCVHKYRCLF